MNYYGGKELAAAFRTVRKNTIQIAEDVPESQYGFKPSPESRSIGQTLTQLHEPVIGLVPRLVAVLLVVLAILPWLVGRWVAFAVGLIEGIPERL